MTSEQLTTKRRGRARRPVLITIMALGTVMSLSAGLGVFAVFTDRATTGTNSASSRAEAASADIQIAAGTTDPASGATTCGAYSEDLATGIITASDMEPLVDFVYTSVCLKNVGSRDVDVTLTVIDLVDTDTACTGDEDALDTTCGSNQLGELSSVLGNNVLMNDCSNFGGGLNPNPTLAELETTPEALMTLSAGETGCLYFEVWDGATGDTLTTTQSDTATWKYAFDATAL